MVGRGELVWSSTLSGSKTAHWLFPKQHSALLQDSTLFGYKKAHVLVMGPFSGGTLSTWRMVPHPGQHIVWLQERNTYFFIKSGMNGSAMAPHGLILSEDGAIPSRMVFIWVWGLFDAILGAFLITNGASG